MRNQRKQDTQVHPACAKAQATTMTPNGGVMNNVQIRLAAILAALFVVFGASGCSAFKASDANAEDTAGEVARDRSYGTNLNELEMKYFGSVQPCKDDETEVECTDRRIFAALAAGEKLAFGEPQSCKDGESTEDCVQRRSDALAEKWVDCGKCTEICAQCAKWISYCGANHGPVTNRMAARHERGCTPQCVQPAPAQPSNGNGNNGDNDKVTLIGQPGPFTLGNVSGTGGGASASAGGGTGTGSGSVGDVSSTGGNVSDSGNSSQGQSQSQAANPSQSQSQSGSPVNITNEWQVNIDVWVEGHTIYISAPKWVHIPDTHDALCAWLRDWYRTHPDPELRDAIIFFCEFDPEDPSPTPVTPGPGTAVPSATPRPIETARPSPTDVPPPTSGPPPGTLCVNVLDFGQDDDATYQLMNWMEVLYYDTNTSYGRSCDTGPCTWTSDGSSTWLIATGEYDRWNDPTHGDALIRIGCDGLTCVWLLKSGKSVTMSSAGLGIHVCGNTADWNAGNAMPSLQPMRPGRTSVECADKVGIVYLFNSHAASDPHIWVAADIYVSNHPNAELKSFEGTSTIPAAPSATRFFWIREGVIDHSDPAILPLRCVGGICGYLIVSDRDYDIGYQFRGGVLSCEPINPCVDFRDWWDPSGC